MRVADYPSRLFAAFAIAVVHALLIYAISASGPHTDRTRANRSIAVSFIPDAEPRVSWRPPEAATVAPAIITPAPILPIIEASLVVSSSDTAISAPQRNTVRPRSSEDGSIPKLVAAVEYLREPSPKYPPQSRRLREQGVVVLRVLIDEHGQACDIAIETSSGYARLDEAAREAVASAAFRPYVESGAPQRALVLIPIEFSLTRGSA
ncbi:MAG: energy transducer TonB [Steroidobacter sp.]